MILIKIFLIVFCAVFVYHFATRKFLNPFRLYMVFGKKGSGKSTFLVRQAIRYKKRGWTVYTNMRDMHVSGIRYFDEKNLGDFIPDPKSVILIDEAGTIWDARSYKTFKESTRDYFKYQRHYHNVVYLASQTFDVDKKLRDLTDHMYLTVNVARIFSLAKKIHKKVALVEASAEGESRIAENLAFRPFWEWKYTYIPKYSKYFDSFNLPNSKPLPYTVCPDESSHDQDKDVNTLTI